MHNRLKAISENIYMLRALLGGVHQCMQYLASVQLQGSEHQAVHAYIEEISTLMVGADSELMKLDQEVRSMRASKGSPPTA